MLTSYICIVAFLHKYIDEFTNIYIHIYIYTVWGKETLERSLRKI